MSVLPCIVCGHLCEPSDDLGGNQPYRGTAFTTTGHYGSTVFDPMMGDQEYLEITVCDPCLIDKRAHVSYGIKVIRREDQIGPWNPPDEVVDQYE